LQAILKNPGVAQALKEYQKAQAAIEEKVGTRRSSSASLSDNLFARRLSQTSEYSNTEGLPIASTLRESSKKQVSKLASVEEQSESEESLHAFISHEGKKAIPTLTSDQDVSDNEERSADLNRKDTGLSTPPKYFRVGSLVPSNTNEDDQDDAPLIDFTRRLSSAALVLANKGFTTPEGHDSSGAEAIPRPKPEAITTAAAAESELVSTFMDMIQRMTRDHEATTEKTEKLLVANKIECQRLATLIATQPPSAPSAPPPDSHAEKAAMLEMAQALSAFGASDAFLMFKRHFHGDNPLSSELQKPSIAMRVPITSVKLEEPWTVEQERPDLFCSTKSLMQDRLRRTVGIPMTMEEMFYCLKADEARYVRAYQTSPLQIALPMGLLERQNLKSQYPLRNYLEMRLELRLQQQRAQPEPQTIFLKATIANGGVFNIVAPEARDRQASWQMDDVQMVGERR
jgi:hypothetical protein